MPQISTHCYAVRTQLCVLAIGVVGEDPYVARYEQPFSASSLYERFIVSMPTCMNERVRVQCMRVACARCPCCGIDCVPLAHPLWRGSRHRRRSVVSVTTHHPLSCASLHAPSTMCTSVLGSSVCSVGDGRRRNGSGLRRRHREPPQLGPRRPPFGGVFFHAGPRLTTKDLLRLSVRRSLSPHAHTYPPTHTPTHTHSRAQAIARVRALFDGAHNPRTPGCDDGFGSPVPLQLVYHQVLVAITSEADV